MQLHSKLQPEWKSEIFSQNKKKKQKELKKMWDNEYSHLIMVGISIDAPPGKLVW